MTKKYEEKVPHSKEIAMFETKKERAKPKASLSLFEGKED
jgi:hypothetical protein